MADEGASSHATENEPGLYEHDYYGWASQQAHALKEQRVEEVDWENLSDEVEILAKTERTSKTG